MYHALMLWYQGKIGLGLIYSHDSDGETGLPSSIKDGASPSSPPLGGGLDAPAANIEGTSITLS